MSEGQVVALLLWLVLLASARTPPCCAHLHANPPTSTSAWGAPSSRVPLWTLRAGLHEGLEIHLRPHQPDPAAGLAPRPARPCLTLLDPRFAFDVT